MSILQCENLSKAYGQKIVLKDLNFTLESGKIYGLIGRNGAGKTTMLSIMSNQNATTPNPWAEARALPSCCGTASRSTASMMLPSSL